jgi:anti-sigma factor RsiW
MTALCCREIRALLVFYPRADLPPSTLQVMTIHLHRCAACRRELATIQRINRHIQSYIHAAPSGDAQAAKQAILACLGSTSVPSRHTRSYPLRSTSTGGDEEVRELL